MIVMYGVAKDKLVGTNSNNFCERKARTKNNAYTYSRLDFEKRREFPENYTLLYCTLYKNETFLTATFACAGTVG
jgi:hypothetical protein